jgi:calmodulin
MSRSRQSNPNVAKSVNPNAVKTGNLTWKERIHPEEYENLQKTFRIFDEDNSGTIDPEEITKVMNDLGDSRKDTLIYDIIQHLAVKGRPINFEEFVDIVSPKVGDIRTKEGIRTIFKHLDTDDDDYINYDELKKLSRMSGDHITDDDILEMLHSASINHKTNNNDGLYFEEFYQIIMKYNKRHGI